MSLSEEDHSMVREYLQQCRLDQVVTIALCGSAGAGKLSMVRKHCTGMIDDPDYPTYHSLWQKREYLHGANFVARWITHLEPPFKEGSQENDLQPDQDMLQKHIAEANAYLLVYDATNDNSLKELRKIHQVIDGSLQVGDRMKPLIIVANKVDVLAEGEGSTIEEGLAFAKSIDSILVKTSAVDGTGLRDIFVEAVSRIVLEWIATDRHPR